MIRIAMLDVAHHRREASGLVSLVAVGITLFIVALTFVGAIQQNADRLLFGTVGAPWLAQPATKSDTITVGPSMSQQFLKTSGAQSLRSRINVTAAISNPAAGTDRPASASVSLVGLDLTQETELAKNFGLQPEQIDRGSIDIHEQVAHQLGVSVGNDVVLRVGASSATYRVAHVFSPSNPNFLLESWVIVDREGLAETLYSDADRANMLLIDAPESDTSRASIEKSLELFGVSATLSSWADTPWSSLMLGAQIWGILLVAVSAFAFVVICIGLTSLVYAALLSRVRDFAVIKTAGAPPRFLHRMYVAEITLQYLAGYVVGVLASTLIVTAVNMAGVSSTNSAFTFAVGSTTLELVPTWWAFVAPLFVGFVLTVGALWLPIRSVTSQPVLTMIELR